ncbi:MAG: response regulator transcription factor [Acidimicrobiia bacterium]|nr:response regulator transcription factor [Acidimicrobiia bacterium]
MVRPKATGVRTIAVVLGVLARSGDSASESAQRHPRPHLVAAGESDQSADRAYPVHVVIVDDHELLRRGLHELFADVDSLALVGEAASGAEAIVLLEQVDADVVIVDVRLPDTDGVEVCREIRSRHPHTRCLILTSYDADEALFAAVAAGASGFLTKDVAGLDLIESVFRVAAGETLIDRDLSHAVLDHLAEEVADRQRLDLLTPQERRIFDLVAEGLSNRDIAEQMFLAEKTVRNYVSNVLAKLTLKRRAELAAFAARVMRRRELD